jgi:hypothetical protein
MADGRWAGGRVGNSHVMPSHGDGDGDGVSVCTRYSSEMLNGLALCLSKIDLDWT